MINFLLIQYDPTGDYLTPALKGHTYDEAIEQLEKAEEMAQAERQARLEAEQDLRQAEVEELALEWLTAM